MGLYNHIAIHYDEQRLLDDAYDNSLEDQRDLQQKQLEEEEMWAEREWERKREEQDA